MATSTEQDIAKTFFETLFAADTGNGGLVELIGTRIHEDGAAGGTTYPCVVFSLYTGDDVSAGNGVRMLTNATYLVRGIGKGLGYANSGAEAIAARIEAVINGKSSGDVHYCERVKPYNRSYTIDGVTYYERGGFYRLRIRPQT